MIMSRNVHSVTVMDAVGLVTEVTIHEVTDSNGSVSLIPASAPVSIREQCLAGVQNVEDAIFKAGFKILSKADLDAHSSSFNDILNLGLEKLRVKSPDEVKSDSVAAESLKMDGETILASDLSDKVKDVLIRRLGLIV